MYLKCQRVNDDWLTWAKTKTNVNAFRLQNRDPITNMNSFRLKNRDLIGHSSLSFEFKI